MSGPNDGGPAFPAPDLGEQDFGMRGAYPGMSVRTYAAIKLAAAMCIDTWPDLNERLEIARSACAMADALLAELSKPVAAVPPVARPLDDWHEDMGVVLWWRFPVDEPPYCGHPNCDDWPGYHTHWTPLAIPIAP